MDILNWLRNKLSRDESSQNEKQILINRGRDSGSLIIIKNFSKVNHISNFSHCQIKKPKTQSKNDFIKTNLHLQMKFGKKIFQPNIHLFLHSI